LAKDVSLVVVDGAGFGNGLMIPAGALREPVSQGLARADGVIIVGDGNPDLGDYKGPVLRVRLESDGDLAGRYFAFAGIGRPEKFLNSLKQAGIEVTGHRFFPDHHPYRAEELTALKAKGPLVTTEKDYVRLAPAARQGIAVLKIAARFDRDPAPLLKGLA
jgi:tetraacyldisaccharide 4'-kinase